jgi:hypothetical protein
MKLMTNGPYPRPYLLPGGWSRYRGGHPWTIDAAAHMRGPGCLIWVALVVEELLQQATRR